MIFDFAKKQLGFKMALFVTGAMAFLCMLVLAVFANLHVQGIPQSTLVLLLAAFGLIFLFVQILLVILSVNLFINRPIHKLSASIQRVVEGNLNADCLYDSADEFGELVAHYNKMLLSLHDMNEMRKRMEQRLIKAEESLKYKNELERKAGIIERMNRELTLAFDDLTLLYMVSQALNSVLEMDELIAGVQKIFTEFFKCDRFGLFILQKDTHQLQFIVGKSWLDHQTKIDQQILNKVQQNKLPVSLNEISLSVNTPSEEVRRLDASLFSMPILVRDEFFGVLTVIRYQKNAFQPTDRQALEAIASQISVAYDRSQLYGKTKELSVRDELTGIYNRRYFHQRLDLELKRADRFKRHVSVLMLDVDHFKVFNDMFGHLKGDELLKRLSRLLERNIREIDLFARFGGEEFIIMLADTQLSDAVNVANKLRELVVSQLDLVGLGLDAQRVKENPITVSIGVSSYPLCAQDHDDLINTADMALYVAKRKGRNQVHCYQSDTLPLEAMMTKAGFIH